jgi:hypothetical protein
MGLEDELRRIGSRRARLAAQLEELDQRRDELIREAAGAGLSNRKTAALLGGITFQRVQQIARDADATP